MKTILAATILTLSILGSVSTASADPVYAHPAWAAEAFDHGN